MDWQRQMLKVIWFVPRLIGKKKTKQNKNKRTFYLYSQDAKLLSQCHGVVAKKYQSWKLQTTVLGAQACGQGLSWWALGEGPFVSASCWYSMAWTHTTGHPVAASLNLSCLHVFALCYMFVSLFCLWDACHAGLGPPCPDSRLCENPISQYSYILRWRWETTIFFMIVNNSSISNL